MCEYMMRLIKKANKHCDMNLEKDYVETFSETTSIETQVHHWGGNMQLSIKGNSFEYLPKIFREEIINPK